MKSFTATLLAITAAALLAMFMAGCEGPTEAPWCSTASSDAVTCHEQTLRQCADEAGGCDLGQIVLHADGLWVETAEDGSSLTGLYELSDDGKTLTLYHVVEAPSGDATEQAVYDVYAVTVVGGGQ